MRWIIAAPSCVGKTTFILENRRIAELTGLKKKPLVMPAYKYLKRKLIDPAYLHYCISFGSKRIWPRLDKPLKAIILIASRSTMVQRALKRKEARMSGAAVARPPMACVRRHTDESWQQLYTLCLEDLATHQVPYMLLNTDVKGYPEIEDITTLDWWDNEQAGS